MNISLNIYGNKEANIGFSQILTVGDIRPLPDESQPGFEGNQEYYIIQNEATGTTFSVVPTRVHSRDSLRLGSLRIAITLPAGTAIEGDVSPFTVLDEVYRLYVSTCMKQGFDSLEYNGLDADRNAFAAVLAKYPLVNKPRPCRPMTGQTAACVVADAASVSQLFADTQYAEFVPYSRIYVAALNGSTLPVLNVAIPRQPLYTVYLNDRQLGVVNPQQNPTFRLTEPAGKYDEGIDVNVSFADAQSGLQPGVVVSPADETIRCKFQPAPIRRACRIAVVPQSADGAEPVQVPVGNFYLRVGRVNKSVDAEGRFELVGDEVDRRWEVKCIDLSMEVRSVPRGLQADGTYLWEVSVRPRRQTVVPPAGRGTTPRPGATASRTTATKGGNSLMTKRQRDTYIALGGLGALLVVVIAGLFLFLFKDDESESAPITEKYGQHDSKLPDKRNGKQEENQKDESAQKVYDHMLERLAAEDLAFSELADFKKKLESENIRECDSLNEKKLSKSIGMYETLENKIAILDIETIRNNCYRRVYSHQQAELLSRYCILYDTGGEIRKIIAESSENIKGFKDIKGIIDECYNKLGIPEVPSQPAPSRPGGNNNKGRRTGGNGGRVQPSFDF